MRIVIVGGGAGGLELATYLGRRLGRKGKAEVTLIDRNQTHVWKPLLHEVASGSIDAEQDAVTYRAHGRRCGFNFELGNLCSVDPQTKTLHLAALHDEDGKPILPPRERNYDLLVLAIGSVSNDFHVPGIAEHCIFLDNLSQAERFQHRMVNGFIRLNQEVESGQNDARLRIAIVGGGATGVELAAELYKARQWFATYGLTAITPEHLEVTLIEAGPRLLPALGDRIALGAHQELEKLGVRVRVATAITSASETGFQTGDGEEIPADLMVWAAGVKAPDFLRDIPGLETNRANQLVVRPTLQVKGDDSIFALGDCAGCPVIGPDGQERWVPPRAQSAHQMASTVGKNIIALYRNKSLQEFKYEDFGSLVSLSQYSAFGRLMGGLARSGLDLEGRFARYAYISLYRMHQVALYGWIRAGLLMLSDRVGQIVKPHFKLH